MTDQCDLRFAYAGDRDLSVWVLDYLLEQGARPEALLVSHPRRATHANALIARCSFLDRGQLLVGKAFREPAGQDLLRQLELDYIIGIHFPYIVPEEVLAIPKIGVLNLHPAYLPYNRGWHTPTWAILDDTPVGATLHFMDVVVDTGDIVHQQQLPISFGDTANSLYQRLKQLEFEVFKDAWPSITAGTYRRQTQNLDLGTEHVRKELFTDIVQQLDLTESRPVGNVLRQLRGLTTNRIDEAAYFEAAGKRYRVQVIIHEETEDDQQ